MYTLKPISDRVAILRRGETVVCESEGAAALTQQQGKLVVEFGPKQD